MAKEYEMLFKLTAALGGNFKGTFSAAMKSANELSDTVKKLNSVTGQISSYQKQSQALTTSRKKLEEVKAKTGELITTREGLDKQLTSGKEKVAKYEKALAALDAELASGAKTQAQYDAAAVKLNKDLEKSQSAVERVEKAVERNENAQQSNASTVARLTDKINKQEKSLDELGTALNSAGINTNKLSEENERLQKTYDRLKSSQAAVDKIAEAQNANKTAISATKSELAKTVGVIAAVGTAATATGVALFKNIVSAGIEYETALTGVIKTVEATPQQIEAISKSLRQMSTEIPVSAVELAGLAETAGQLGIETKNIVSFTRTMADLSATTNIAGAEGAAMLAKYANITGMSQDKFDEFGSTIVALGNNLATTENDILNMSMRLAAAGKQIGLTDAEILGFSGALSSVGLEAEAGGSAFTKVMQSMQLEVATNGKKLSNFATVAGMSTKQFSEYFKKDAAGALLAFTKGLGDTEKLGKTNLEFLKDMGLSGIRVSDALLRASGANVTFEEALKLGATAFEENTALAKEAATRYGTTESQIETLKNAFKDLRVELAGPLMSATAPIIGKLKDLVLQVTELVKNNPEGIKNLAEKISKAATTVIDKITEISKTIYKFVNDNPKAVKAIGMLAAGLAGTKVAALTGKLGFLELKNGVLKVREVISKFRLKNAQTAADAITGSKKYLDIGKSINGYFGGIGKSLGGVGEAVGKFGFVQKISGALSTAGGKMSGFLVPGLQKVTGLFGSASKKIPSLMSGGLGKVTGLFGKVRSTIAKSPIGKIGSVIGGGFSKLGGVFKSVGGVASSVLGPALNGLGSGIGVLGKGFGGLFGKVMPIIAIISLLAAAFVKLSGGDLSAFIEPLKQAFADAQPVIQNIMEQFKGLAQNIMPMLMNAATQLLPLFGKLVQGILPIVLNVIQQLTPMLISIVQSILPVFLNVMTQLMPTLTEVITSILPVVLQLIQTLLPIITQLVTSILPIVADALNAVLPIIKDLITAVLPVLMSVLNALMPVIKVVAGVFSDVFGAAIEGIKPVIDAVMKEFKGLIDFISGVFSGDWSKAWNGIKDVFGGIFEGLVSLIKLPINTIIRGINSIFSKIGEIKIPDWVPLIGGKTFSLPKIPEFAKGSNFTPDTFVAGERGAELITNSKGSKVFTAAQTSQIMQNINAAETINKISMLNPNNPAQQNNAPSPLSLNITGGKSQGVNLTVNYNPQITVNGDKPGDLEEKLQESEKRIVARFEAMLRDKKDKEERMVFA
ncbi:hypothetical protein FACS18949_13570 [Clostridia bacterium]|nr:hypothetical protein FACS189425_06260 [Clostridia bacterium]GHV35485.1 hypothetical protein FACS18949_13570 [Clostridia bacterium]